MVAVIGANGLEIEHPDQESDVDVTGVLLLVASQVGNDVTSTEAGTLDRVAIRLGASAGVGQCGFLITTGTLAGDEYTVRDVMTVAAGNDGTGTTLYKIAASPGPVVEPGDYIGVYGIDPIPDGYIATMVVDNADQGTYRQDAPATTPEPGDVLTVSAPGAGMPLLCSPWPPDPPPPPPEPEFDCACPEDFRFEAADLRTGVVKAILEPLSADWQTTLNQVGQGSMTLATKGVRARDIWPHLTSVYCLRTSGGDATPENPYCEGGFLIDKFTATDTGQTNVGFRAIEDYIWHRILRSDLEYNGGPPTRLAAILVNTTTGNGIPLTGEFDTSTETTDREYFAYDRKNVGEAINELVEAEPGIEWEMVHTKSPGGAWSSTMVFRDTVGAVRALVLQSDVEGAGYGLDVDAADHATLVDAIGEGNEDDQLIATAIDTGTYPQFDAAPAFKDINILPTLQQQANGYLADHREPVAVPSMTIMGTRDPDPALLRNGDTVERVRTNFGALSYDGPARIVSTSWSLKLGGVSRTYQFLSTGRASQTVLNQDATDECPDCAPVPDSPPGPVPYILEFAAYEVDYNDTDLPDGDGIVGVDPWDDESDATYLLSVFDDSDNSTLRPVGHPAPLTLTTLTKMTLTYRASIESASPTISASGSLFFSGFTVPGYGTYPSDLISFPNSPGVSAADVAAGTILDTTVEIDWAALVESNPAYQDLIDLILPALAAGTLGVAVQGRADDTVTSRASSETKVYKVDFTVEGT